MTTGVFCGSCAQNQISLVVYLTFWGGSQTQILLRGLLSILGTPWDLLGFRGRKSIFTLGTFVLLGRLPNSNFTPEAFFLLERLQNSNFTCVWPILGANWDLLWFRKPKSIFTLGEFVLLGRLPNSNFTPGAFVHFWDQLGPFGVQGHKIKFVRSFYPSLVSRTQIGLGGFCPCLGPQTQF
jgi:hypothetical protein